MKHVSKFILLIFITTFFTSCEQELQLEDTTVANASSGVNSNIKRNRLKQRNNGIYKNVLSVTDPLGTIASMEVEMFPTNDIIGAPNIYFPDLVGEGEGTKKFKFNQLNFENGTAAGWPFKQRVILKDLEGESLGDPIETWVTAQDNDQVELLDITLKQNGPTSDYKIKAKFQAADSSLVDNVTIYFKEVSEDRIFEKNNSEDRGWFTSNRRGGRGQDDIYSFRWFIDYDEADGFESELINPITNEVGLVVEVKNESGVVIDNDLFIVRLEDTGPSEITIRNTKHKIKANGDNKITLRYEQTGMADAELTEYSIPNANADGSSYNVVAVRIPGTQYPTFKATIDPLENINIGDTYTTLVVAYDENDEIISELETTFTVEGQNATTTVAPYFEELAEGESDSFQLISFTVPDLNGDGIVDFQPTFSGTAQIIPQDGGSETEQEVIDLSLISVQENRVVFEADVLFVEPGNVIDMEYQITYTYYNADGDEVGSVDTMIIPQETPAPRFTTCMTNGSAPNLFDYSVTTNEPAYQNADVIYVNFGDKNGENLSPECSFPMFRNVVNGDMITFKGENIRFLDLSIVDAESSIYFSTTLEGSEVAQISFTNSEIIHNLGFLNQDTGEWECEENCLSNGDSCTGGDYKNDYANGVLTVHVCHF